MEILEKIWNYALPIGGGITVGAIVIVVLTFLFKNVLGGQLTKKLNEIDVAAIEKKAVDTGVSRLKEMSFTQSIEPLVKSELIKYTEIANGYLKEDIAVMQAQIGQLLSVLKALAAYFDNSIGVSDEAKAALKETIEGAEAVIKPQKTAECKVVYEDEEKPVKAETKADTTTNEQKKEEARSVKRVER